MARRLGRDDGFTLVELMVAVVVLGILAAIAIPLMLHQKAKAYEASMRNSLRSAAGVQEMWATEQGAYTTRLADLESRGYRQSDRVSVSVALVPGGYCMRADQPDTGMSLYLSNVGPRAGRPTASSC